MSDKEVYEIWKDGRMFASFEQGDDSRFEEKFNRQVAGRELDSCIAHHMCNKGNKSKWELRIIPYNPNRDKRYF